MLDFWEQLCKECPPLAYALVIILGGIAFAVVNLVFRKKTITVSPSGQRGDGDSIPAKLAPLAEETDKGPLATYRETVVNAERHFELFASHLIYTGVEESDIHHSTIYLRDLLPQFSESAVRNPYRIPAWGCIAIGILILSIAFYFRATSPEMERFAGVLLLGGLICVGLGALFAFGARRLPSFQFLGTKGDVLLGVGPFTTQSQKAEARAFCERVQDQIQKVLKAEAESRG